MKGEVPVRFRCSTKSTIGAIVAVSIHPDPALKTRAQAPIRPRVYADGFECFSSSSIGRWLRDPKADVEKLLVIGRISRAHPKNEAGRKIEEFARGKGFRGGLKPATVRRLGPRGQVAGGRNDAARIRLSRGGGQWRDSPSGGMAETIPAGPVTASRSCATRAFRDGRIPQAFCIEARTPQRQGPCSST